MDKLAIEYEARELLKRIYREEKAHRPGVLAPMQMMEPQLVASYLDFELVYVPRLGTWRSADGARFEIAGSLDQQRRLIHVSGMFPHPVQRFTAAHEIGHIVLRHPSTVVHRDRPVFELDSGWRPTHEAEADYFASCLLVPKRLLEIEYEKRFPLGPPLPLDDAVAFNLCGRSAHALMRAGPRSMEFASAVASARSFNGRHFRSLADTFNVSTSAMAIRLRELQFLRE